MTVIDVCSMCGEETVCYGAGEPTPVCGVCIERVLPIAKEAELERRLHDKVQHPWPVIGCERCAVRR